VPRPDVVAPDRPALTAATLKARAQALGFEACGIARADRFPRLTALSSWIDRGYAGQMRYLVESLDDRLDPRRFLPTAQAVVSLGSVYNTPAAERARPAGTARIARYARGEDYHDVLRRRVRALVTWMAETAGPGLEALSCVDDGPVQERVFAEQAGLGWIGKNTCLISPTLGSWMFLAEILTNAPLEPDRPAVDQCGSCTRCLEACPTGALVAPYTLDATRCLAYLTIELRAPVDEALRPAITEEIFGCDICQEVCPWNRRAATSAEAAWQPRPGSEAAPVLDWCRRSDEAWRRLLRGSALRRAGLRRIRRSLAYAAASLPAEEGLTALAALEAHPSARDALVLDAVGWARAVISRASHPS
jgi:epoxyqueuosine reductase